MREKIIEAISGFLFVVLVAGIIILLFFKYASEPMPTYESVASIEADKSAPVTTCDPLQATESSETITSLGTFTITYYCPCEACCGKSDGITASGTIATQGRTIAADTSIYPIGTELYIDGHKYIVEDCGGAINGNRIDIFMNSHNECLQNGIDEKEVFILN